MKIVINKSVLFRALGDIAPLAGKVKAMKMYDCVKFKTKGNRIRVQTSDTSSIAREFIEAVSIDEDVEFLVNAKDIIGYLSMLPDGVLEIEVRKDENRMFIQHDAGRCELPLEDAENFIEPTTYEETTHFSVESAALRDAIEKALPFTASSEIRPVMQSIEFFAENNSLAYQATDGRCMIRCYGCTTLEGVEVRWKIHQNVAPILAKILLNSDTTEITVSDKNVEYKCGNIIFYAQNIEGKFPNCDSVIPKAYNLTTTISKLSLMTAVGRATKVVQNASRAVKFDIVSDSIKLTATDLDFGKEANEKISCQSDGSIVIGLSSSILQSIMKSLTHDEVELHITDPTRPVIALDPTDKSVVTLIMPVIIENNVK
jgi:DNA polymerase-3 subunit beta